MVGLGSSEGSDPTVVCGLASEGPQWYEGLVGMCRLALKSPKWRRLKLFPYKEEGEEIASGLPVVPVPTWGAQERLAEVSPDGDQCHQPPLPEDVSTKSLLHLFSFIHSFVQQIPGGQPHYARL